MAAPDPSGAAPAHHDHDGLADAAAVAANDLADRFTELHRNITALENQVKIGVNPGGPIPLNPIDLHDAFNAVKRNTRELLGSQVVYSNAIEIRHKELSDASITAKNDITQLMQRAEAAEDKLRTAAAAAAADHHHADAASTLRIKELEDEIHRLKSASGQASQDEKAASAKSADDVEAKLREQHAAFSAEKKVLQRQIADLNAEVAAAHDALAQGKNQTADKAIAGLVQKLTSASSIFPLAEKVSDLITALEDCLEANSRSGIAPRGRQPLRASDLTNREPLPKREPVSNSPSAAERELQDVRDVLQDELDRANARTRSLEEQLDDCLGICPEPGNNTQDLENKRLRLKDELKAQRNLINLLAQDPADQAAQNQLKALNTAVESLRQKLRCHKAAGDPLQDSPVLKLERVALQNELDDRVAEIATLTATINRDVDLASQVAALTQLHRDTIDQSNYRQSQIDALTRRLHDCQDADGHTLPADDTKIADLEGQVTTLTAELKKTVAANASLAIKESKATQARKALETKLKEAQAKLEAQDDGDEDQSSLIADLSAQLTEAKDLWKAAVDRAANTMNITKATQALLEKQLQKNLQLTEQLAHEQAQVARLQAQGTEDAGEGGQSGDVAKTRRTNSANAAALEELTREINEIRTEHLRNSNHAKKTTTELRKQVAALTEQLRRASKEPDCAKLLAMVDALNAQVEEKDAQLKDCEKTKTKLAGALRQIDHLTALLEAASAHRDERKLETEPQGTPKSDNDAELTAARARIEELILTKHSLKARNAELEERLAGEASDAPQQPRSPADLQRELSEKKKELQKLKAQNTRLKNQRDDGAPKGPLSDDDNDDDTAEIVHLVEEVASLKALRNRDKATHATKAKTLRNKIQDLENVIKNVARGINEAFDADTLAILCKLDRDDHDNERLALLADAASTLRALLDGPDKPESHESHQNDSDDDDSLWAERAADLEAKLAASNAANQELKKKLAAAKTEHDDEVEALKRQIAELEASYRTLKDDLFEKMVKWAEYEKNKPVKLAVEEAPPNRQRKKIKSSQVEASSSNIARKSPPETHAMSRERFPDNETAKATPSSLLAVRARKAAPKDIFQRVTKTKSPKATSSPQISPRTKNKSPKATTSSPPVSPHKERGRGLPRLPAKAREAAEAEVEDASDDSSAGVKTRRTVKRKAASASSEAPPSSKRRRATE